MRAGGRRDGQTNTRMDTHMTKLLFALRDLAKAPRNLHKQTKEMGSQTGTGQGKAVSVLTLKGCKESTS